MAVNIYLISQKGMGYELTISDNPVSYEEFKRICDIIVNEYGNDLFIVREKLKTIYGLKILTFNVHTTFQIKIGEIKFLSFSFFY
ncbi:Uncharacterised protein [[Clostridium] sordellii]|uniref:hypothetical protein n=1 Tax=Paraclostridium sordellii TaxID=1505 RepID=UPI0005DC56B8|nr:hypothetical protein [Paeniclostridium sordellii]CEQ01691.1 Uncharacterised protein [[Clostridium] sordellii] [Paeniclostridium sordellii]